MGVTSNPKISIIVPVYNSEKYLKQCIESILNQTFTDFELILIDDGSTDNSSDICDEFAKIDPRIVVRHKENGGICSARNLGLDIARGDYIGFSDCDDLMNKYMYEVLYKSLIKENAEMSCCYCTTESEEFDYNKVFENKSIIVDKEFIYRNLYGISKNDYQYMPMWNKLMRRELFYEIRFDDNGAEDLNITNKLFNLSKKIVLVNSELYCWRQHYESVTHRRFNKRNLEILNTYINCYKYLIENSKEEYAHMCLYKWVKVALNSRYNSKKTRFENEVKFTVNKQFKEYYGVFLRSNFIGVKEKFIFSVFRFMPFTYDLFRKVTES